MKRFFVSILAIILSGFALSFVDFSPKKKRFPHNPATCKVCAVRKNVPANHLPGVELLDDEAIHEPGISR